MPDPDRPAERSPLRLGVLDQSPISEGSSGAEALQATLDLARAADSLGYHRYWVAEHHGTPTLASTSPEVLVGPIAAVTTRMRVGTGGVMLPHYSPRKVAESFSVLSALFPGRIDLGLGRAAGADPVTTHALQRDRRTPSPDDFPDQLAELLAYIEERPTPDARFAGLVPLPGRPGSPQPWLLGSSLGSATSAGQLGLPYAYGDFINPKGADMTRLYRRLFSPSERLAAPLAAVCVAVVCAEDDEAANRLAASSLMVSSMARRGTPIEVPPPEKALRYLATADGDDPAPNRRVVVGPAATVRAGLESVAADYDAEELIILTITHDPAARLRSYELVAEAFGLRPAAPLAQTV